MSDLAQGDLAVTTVDIAATGICKHAVGTVVFVQRGRREIGRSTDLAAYALQVWFKGGAEFWVEPHEIASAADLLIGAMKARRRVQLRDEKGIRVVEVHACGLVRDRTSDRLLVADVWQVRSDLAARDRPGWKRVRVYDATELQILDEASEAPRPGYTPGSSIFTALLYDVAGHLVD